jgi:Raf kinase inhibitor-like YbhB/YbcL family protein
MRISTQVIAGLVGAAALVAGTVTAAAAHEQHGDFGYHSVRRGIPDRAVSFSVASPDLRNGGTFRSDTFANAFGCSGTNARPRLHWSGAPARTQSLAVTMYDPQAPTGSGFWHWQTWDLPAATTDLGTADPAGAVSGTGDAGVTGYLGPCPPAGDVPHHYEITVYALDVASLALPAATPPAVTAFTMSSHIIGYGRLTATARR